MRGSGRDGVGGLGQQIVQLDGIEDCEECLQETEEEETPDSKEIEADRDPDTDDERASELLLATAGAADEEDNNPAIILNEELNLTRSASSNFSLGSSTTSGSSFFPELDNNKYKSLRFMLSNAHSLSCLL